MRNWQVTWIDGNVLRTGRVYTMFDNLANALSSIGCYNWSSVIKVEVIPE